MPTIKEWMKEVARVEGAHGWTSKVNPGDDGKFCEKLLLVISEIVEALEEFRAGHALQEVYFPISDAHLPKLKDKPEGIPIELADAVIRIFAFCESNSIDLEEAIRTKNAYNETRPWRHGGKRV